MLCKKHSTEFTIKMRGLSIVIVILVSFLDVLKSSPTSRGSSFTTASFGEQHRLERARRYTIDHDYLTQVFMNAVFGNWKKKNCDVKYNCHMVSPQHCSAEDKSFFFCAEKQLPGPCSLDFRFNIEDNSSVTGFDLALYKAAEPEAAPSDVYVIYFLLAHSATDQSVELVLEETINASCSGWQMFHLDHDIMSEFISDGLNVINFELLVFKNDEFLSLPCKKVHSLFVFNATAHQTPAAPHLSPSNGTTNGTADAETTITVNKTQGNPFSLKEERMDNHVPILNMFAVRRNTNTLMLMKRAVRPIPLGLDVTIGFGSRSTPQRNSLCQRKDRWMRMNTTIFLNGEEVKVLAPKIYNAGLCTFSELSSQNTMQATCQPVAEMPVKLLLERGKKGSGQPFIHESSELKVIQTCG